MSNALVGGSQRAVTSLHVEVGLLNQQRIGRIAPVLIVVHLGHLFLFWPYTAGATAVALVWRNGIILSHGIMLVISLVIGGAILAQAPLSRRFPRWPVIFPTVVSLLYLLFGASVAAVDQLVTSAITPLLVACIGVAAIIVIPPMGAAINYTITMLYALAIIPLTQAEPELMLSVQSNLFTAVALGFGLALVLWRSHRISIQQRWQIEAQQRELEAKNAELERLATRDVLTGLLNRSEFIGAANRTIATMQRNGGTACLIMLDIDHFKQVNDTFGHPVGDSTLVAVARIMMQTVRSVDTVARMGGEEFGVLLPGADLAEGEHVAERLRAAIEEHTYVSQGRPVKVTASVGVAELSGERLSSLESGYRAADQALYRAKGEGRNCVRCAG